MVHLGTAVALLLLSPCAAFVAPRVQTRQRCRSPTSRPRAASVTSVATPKSMPDEKRPRPQLSRRNLIGGAAWAAGAQLGIGTASRASAYKVNQVKPDEKDTYWEAQKSNGKGPLRILWVGAGDMSKAAPRSLFQAGNEVVALDLVKPDAIDLSAAATYATEHGYQMRFEQGDATKLKFDEGTFDVVVCSMFLCQDFDPKVVVSEIRRVLKPGGRFGFYEHEEDIDKVIVSKVFGERSVVRIEAYPERTNVIAGVVRKV